MHLDVRLPRCCDTNRREELLRTTVALVTGVINKRRRIVWTLCTGQFQNRPSPPPPPGQTTGHLTFLKNFGQILCYIVSLDGQMPRPLELQRGSNPPPSRHAKATVETSFAKFSATTNFLFSLSSLNTLNKGLFHHITT